MCYSTAELTNGIYFLNGEMSTHKSQALENMKKGEVV